MGIVIGAGIFRVPSDVAGATGSGAGALALWLAGGLAALVGALCYAELASRFPSIGGEFHFLRLAWGARISALFLWARIAVMQTGSIATVAFVAGDYAAAAVPGGPSGAIWAAAAIMAVTAANLVGLESGRRSQLLFVGLQMLAFAAVLLAAILIPPGAAAPAPTAPAAGGGIGIGLAFVFVMLAYGGWNEAAYLSAEVKGGSRALLKALLIGLGLVTALYLAINLAFLRGFGAAGLAATPAPATRLAEAAYGSFGALLVGGSVVAAALSTLNATVMTGARAMCAGARHLPLLGPLGAWDDARSVPRPALLLQGAVALALTAYGATTRDGFTAMVAFGAPVFWLFLALTAAALFRLRKLFPDAPGYRVPLYPLLPLLFLGLSLYMLWSALGYAQMLLGSSQDGRLAGVMGLALLALGLPLVWKAR